MTALIAVPDYLFCCPERHFEKQSNPSKESQSERKCFLLFSPVFCSCFFFLFFIFLLLFFSHFISLCACLSPLLSTPNPNPSHSNPTHLLIPPHESSSPHGPACGSRKPRFVYKTSRDEYRAFGKHQLFLGRVWAAVTKRVMRDFRDGRGRRTRLRHVDSCVLISWLIDG